MVFVSENFLPKMQNLGLEIRHLGSKLMMIYISSVGHLQPSVGKLQLPATNLFDRGHHRSHHNILTP